MPYNPTLATLGFVLSADGREVLLVHRHKRADDPHLGKYNGLGGKLEAGEDIVQGICREIREEAGLTCVSLRLRGTISWPGFGTRGDDWFGFLFIVDEWTGTPKMENPEGTLSWVPIDQILDLPLWEGDRYFLPILFDKDGPPFHGVMPYCEGRPVSWSYTSL